MDETTILGDSCSICLTEFIVLTDVPKKKRDMYCRNAVQSRSFSFSCSSCVTKACRIARRHNKRGKKHNAGKITPGDWLCCLFAHKFACAYCGSKDKKLTLDHILPLSNGGKNAWSNIQPLCEQCHFEKDRIIPLAEAVGNREGSTVSCDTCSLDS